MCAQYSQSYTNRKQHKNLSLTKIFESKVHICIHARQLCQFYIIVGVKCFLHVCIPYHSECRRVLGCRCSQADCWNCKTIPYRRMRSIGKYLQTKLVHAIEKIYICIYIAAYNMYTHTVKSIPTCMSFDAKPVHSKLLVVVCLCVMHACICVCCLPNTVTSDVMMTMKMDGNLSLYYVCVKYTRLWIFTGQV